MRYRRAMGKLGEEERARLEQARAEMKRQLDVVGNPIRSIDFNPVLVRRLTGMIADIDDLLSEDVADHPGG
jgi:hypothetical protein